MKATPARFMLGFIAAAVLAGLGFRVRANDDPPAPRLVVADPAAVEASRELEAATEEVRTRTLPGRTLDVDKEFLMSAVRQEAVSTAVLNHASAMILLVEGDEDLRSFFASLIERTRGER